MAAAGTAMASVSGEETAEKPRVANGRDRDEEARWRPLLDLPCELSVDLPFPHFTVADFLKLQRGSLVGTEWRLARDVPLRINGTLIGWGEFEGSSKRLAVRLTELA